jgi:predicted Zn-dependent peptidase
MWLSIQPDTCAGRVVPHISIDRHALGNGLRVILSQDDRAPMAAVNLWYAVGSGHEEAGKTGFAHLQANNRVVLTYLPDAMPGD